MEQSTAALRARIGHLTRELDEARAERDEARRQQTGTADVLKVISRASFDLQPVLVTLVETATTLCRADNGFLFLLSDGRYRLQASFGFAHEVRQFIECFPIAPEDTGTLVGRTAAEGRVVHIEDAANDPRYTWTEGPERANLRSGLGVPLLRDGQIIGVLSLARHRVEPFTDKQIELVTTFADQAVIAIENTRLFEEVQARTRELTGSLEQQTATAEILRIISASPGRLEPVFDAILESARELCAVEFGHLLLFDGQAWTPAALHNVPEAYARFWRERPVIADATTSLGRVQRTGRPDQVTDVLAGPGYISRTQLGVATAELGKARSLVGVPLLKEGNVIGAIVLYRGEVRPFDDRQITLLQAFADQAVIAIENARLFEAEQTRTRALQEFLSTRLLRARC